MSTQSAELRLQSAACTDAGRTRSHNEDAYLDSLPLVAVADGVGGNKAGAVASAIAVEILQACKKRMAPAAPKLLQEAAMQAHEEIRKRAGEHDDLEGMATTLTAAWLGDNITLTHVGDSRAYLFRADRLWQLTRDHTLAEHRVRSGELSAGEAARHRDRKVIMQALGGKMPVNVDMLTVDLRPKDRLLLATDGLLEIQDRDIREILRSCADIRKACETLVDAANDAGGTDNITAVLVEAS